MKKYKFYNSKKELVCWYEGNGIIDAIKKLQVNPRHVEVSKYVREFELDKQSYHDGSEFIKL